MNFKSLSTDAMIALSGFIVANARSRAILDPHLLGHASLAHLAQAHDLLVAMRTERAQNLAEVSSLTQIIKHLVQLHDRKARAFQHGLLALREGVDDEALKALCDELLARCFPDGMNVVNQSYLDKAGWTIAVRHLVDGPVMARLCAVQMGPYTLGEMLRAWLDAGTELGERVLQRAQLQAATAPTGTAADRININKVRSLWIRTMNAFTTNTDLLPLTLEERDELFSPIEASVARALDAAARAASSSAADADDDAGAATATVAVIATDTAADTAAVSAIDIDTPADTEARSSALGGAAYIRS